MAEIRVVVSPYVKTPSRLVEISARLDKLQYESKRERERERRRIAKGEKEGERERIERRESEVTFASSGTRVLALTTHATSTSLRCSMNSFSFVV